MIPDHILEKLRENWGERADCLSCNIECRVYDPASTWEWFIYAQDPNDHDCLLAIQCFDVLTLLPMSYQELKEAYNWKGEGMLLDHEFKPRNAGVFYQKLRKRYGSEVNR